MRAFLVEFMFHFLVLGRGGPRFRRVIATGEEVLFARALLVEFMLFLLCLGCGGPRATEIIAFSIDENSTVEKSSLVEKEIQIY